VKLNETMRGITIGVIKASRSKKFPVGSLATGMTGWTELAVMPESECQRVILPKGGRLTDALSVLGKFSLSLPPSPFQSQPSLFMSALTT
jgi:NADPH-dependent curcumin reductase CurA